MGSVKKYLHQSKLPNREKHHSRLFVDLAENIHIHHREYRTVFSLDEYFEYADIIQRSTEDVRNFLIQNSEYKEETYPTTILIAGGKERQLNFLENSKLPNVSTYYDEIFAIELQDEYVTDEVHIHYRDFRIGVDRERFRLMAKGFTEALETLDEFEKTNTYERKSHPDRLISTFNNENKSNTKTKLMGVKNLSLDEISSYWYNDISEWEYQKEAIDILMEDIKNDINLCPILVSTEVDGRHLIVDGHHRYLSYKLLGRETIPCFVIDISFEKTEKIRKAEVLLKEFDRENSFEYNMSGFMKSYLGYASNKFYSNSFKNKIKGRSIFKRAIIKVLTIMGLKEFVFKKFYESHNHHN
ncbi:TPA: ParB-like nuclease domain-containing protein [Vibrio fluvialis]|nr:ParB-like nuclease domain-containing protein [Vibrio fluvialis]